MPYTLNIKIPSKDIPEFRKALSITAKAFELKIEETKAPDGISFQIDTKELPAIFNLGETFGIIIEFKRTKS